MTALPPTPVTGSNKAIGAILAGSASVILTYVLNAYIHPPLPAEIGQAIQTLLTTLVVYYVPHGGDA